MDLDCEADIAENAVELSGSLNLFPLDATTSRSITFQPDLFQTLIFPTIFRLSFLRPSPPLHGGTS